MSCLRPLKFVLHGLLTLVVLQITDGERLTLTLWFSQNSSHDEDVKLLSLLNQNISGYGHTPCIPLPASSNMYWFPSDPLSDHQQGFDLCFARLFFLGYDIYPSQGNTCLPEMVSSGDFSDVFTNPVKLARGGKLFSKEFANLLHALQVISPSCHTPITIPFSFDL